MKQERLKGLYSVGRLSRGLAIAVFVGLSIAANCTEEVYITVGGLNMKYLLPISMLMILLGGLDFLISPRLARIDILWRHTVVLVLPVLFPLIWSMGVWAARGVGVSEVRRGLMSAAYVVFGICAMASFVYVVGEHAVWWFLLSLVAANMITIASVIMESGISAFLAEFGRLLFTFAEDTGPLMKRLEVQGLTYALGIYLTAILLDYSSIKKTWPLHFLTLFCFLTGLKRIGVLAILIAAAAGWIFLALRDYPEIRRILLKTLFVIFSIMTVVYVVAVYFGLFDYMESIGMDTNMRAHIYGIYKPYYSVSPFYPGNGAGWVDDVFQKWQSVADELTIFEVYHTHNDFLREFIELGMVGFIIWCGLRFHYQITYSGKILGMRGEVLCLGLLAYMGITYMTDSTSTQVYINNAFAMVLLSYHLSDRERLKRCELELKNRRISDPEG